VNGEHGDISGRDPFDAASLTKRKGLEANELVARFVPKSGN
jgi:hypothetical protein